MKGVVLVNCGRLGLDPASLSLSGYLEALWAGNSDGDTATADTDTTRLSRFLNAHRGMDNAY